MKFGMKIAAMAFGGIAVGALAQQQAGPIGYLKPGAFDILAVLPQLGDARDLADRAVFRATRKADGTVRWDLATNDVKTDTR